MENGLTTRSRERSRFNLSLLLVTAYTGYSRDGATVEQSQS